MVNRLVPGTLLRDTTQIQLVQRALQGAIPVWCTLIPRTARRRWSSLKSLTRTPRDTLAKWRLRGSVNKLEQQLYPGHQARLRSKDRGILHTPDGTVGPLEHGFTGITNPTDFKGWVLGFYGEWSDEVTKLPTMLDDAQVATWQSKYGRDRTDQHRSWLVNKIRTDIAMKGIKRRTSRTCTRSPLHPREREGGWSLSARIGLACKAEDHTQADTATAKGVADAAESRDRQNSSRRLNSNHWQ